MTKSVYEILASKVVDTVEAIQDPVEKAKAIGKFMEILKDKDVESAVTPIKVKAAKEQEEKAETDKWMSLFEENKKRAGGYW